MRGVSRKEAGILCHGVLTLVFAACGTSPKEYFYTLSSDATSTNSFVSGTTVVPSILVGPVTLPEIADRPQIVTRVGTNQVTIAEEHRWAASLRSEIPRVIAQNLSDILGAGYASSYEDNSGGHADIRVLVDVQRFEATLGETVAIDSLWTVRSAGGKSTTNRSTTREPIRGSGYDEVIAAYARALAKVSRDIGQVIRSNEMFRR